MTTTRVPRSPERARRYLRITAWSILSVILAALILPLGGYVWVGLQPVQAQATQDTNPRANYWRAVRQGAAGYSAVSGRTATGEVLNEEPNVLIQNGGQNWRQLRDGVLANYGGWLLFLVVIAILVFFAYRGTIELEEGRSGRRLLRWKPWERVLHWYTAILFVILAVTGLSLLFGRVLMIPLLGKAGFAVWADIAKGLHNYAGPAFSVGVALMVVFWVGHNIPSRDDWEWFKSGGGIIGKAHPHAGFVNAGEKIWFWFIAIVGGASIITGFLLDFPGVWGQTRETMQLANLVHGASALAWIAMWFGHAYIGTAGSEGSLEAMSTGYVDVNWARQHHDRWYEQVKDQAVAGAPAPAPEVDVGKGQTAT